jgi:hypothetical protein
VRDAVQKRARPAVAADWEIEPMGIAARAGVA